MRFGIPEDALPIDHRARLLWRVVETLDLAAFTSGVRARKFASPPKVGFRGSRCPGL